MALDASVEGTDLLDIHWAWGVHRNLTHVETSTFRNLNLDLDSVLDVNVINMLQMESRGPKKWRQKIHRNFKGWFLRKYSNLYFKIHQKIVEGFRLGGPLAHTLAPTWSNHSVRFRIGWIGWIVWISWENASGQSIPVLNHTYGREFSLTSNRGCFRCSLWLLLLCSVFSTACL